MTMPKPRPSDAGELDAEVAAVQQQVLAAEDEDEQHEVAGEHVAEESQRERERPDEEVGDELEDEHDRAQPPGRPGGTSDFR
jgi:hypothetical protein